MNWVIFKFQHFMHPHLYFAVSRLYIHLSFQVSHASDGINTCLCIIRLDVMPTLLNRTFAVNMRYHLGISCMHAQVLDRDFFSLNRNTAIT